MTTIMFCLPCNRLPCNQIYNVRTICENIKGRGGRDRMVIGFTNCTCSLRLSPLKL